ncbi:hypothetical protein SCE1572_41780 [Sorangium cellulosum So0157-2]|uniref:Uncharacterized protein n=1 Tax=Sorangium cellulosum So0157-2 TaxID=1254432 RepID=S4Y4Y0_SORCE|nr:hypothetical protein SCE1572_41780 [Sorangium cellulosum So0157-2]
MFLGSVTTATRFIRPLQAGHSRTSIANVRRKSSAQLSAHMFGRRVVTSKLYERDGTGRARGLVIAAMSAST